MSKLVISLTYAGAVLMWAGVLIPYWWWLWVSGAGFLVYLCSLGFAFMEAHRKLKELG